MNKMTRVIGPLVEAWQEVRVQKTRVILSLIGIIAAVAAMSIVSALSELQLQSIRESQEKLDGRETTLRFMISNSMDSDAASTDFNEYTENEITQPSASENNANNTLITPLKQDITAQIEALDPAGTAIQETAKRLQVNYWTRVAQRQGIVREFREVQNTGLFQGQPVEIPEYGMSDPRIIYVDSSYQTIFRLQVIAGRWLNDADSNALLTPVVINEAAWKQIGRPKLSEPLILNVAEDFNSSQTTQMRVVGITREANRWAEPQIIAPYSRWQLNHQPGETLEALFWVSPDSESEAFTALNLTLSGLLGDKWVVDSFGNFHDNYFEATFNTIRLATMIIGGIIVALGALGLLNVAIVTVRQRMREIGIRRAMGASGKRIFFAVFMESVVATLVAGIVGLMIAIIVVKYLPLEKLDIYLEDIPAFPLRTALAGLSISAGIGALCGIIPAIAATKVKPIDAIRA